MSTAKRLVKELILVSGLKGLSIGNFIARVLGLAKAATDHPLIAPDLDPVPANIKIKANAITVTIGERTALQTEVKAKTASISAAKSELTNLINNSWAPQAQLAIAGDIELAKELAWFIKGVDTGEAPVKAIVGNATNSYPSIQKIESSTHLQHTVFTRNSANGKAGVPKDAKSIEIYMQVGGLTPPVDTKGMTHLGSATRGNLVNNFDAADLGKTVYYIAVYFDKKTKKALTLCPVMSAVIS